jgi:hypothetical protein
VSHSGASDVTAALGRMNSSLGAVSIAVGAALQAAERREREADRREKEAAAVIADAERRVEHLTGLLDHERSHKGHAEYRRGYLAGRAVGQQNRGTEDLEADADVAVGRRRRRRTSVAGTR